VDSKSWAGSVERSLAAAVAESAMAETAAAATSVATWKAGAAWQGFVFGNFLECVLHWSVDKLNELLELDGDQMRVWPVG